MFKAGDKISYPMHGAGVIEAVEERLFLDEKKQYYILKFSEGDIKVHVPVETAQKAGFGALFRPMNAAACLSRSKRLKMWRRVPTGIDAFAKTSRR